MANRIEIEVGGCVNGTSIEVAGDGTHGGDGATVLALRSMTRSLAWDHALLFQPLADLVALTAQADLDTPVPACAHLFLADEDGRAMGDVAVLALVTRHSGAVRIQTQVTRGACHLEPGEKAVAVDEARRTAVLPHGIERRTVTSAWSWRTGRGHRYWSVATVTSSSGSARTPTSQLDVRVERESGTVRAVAQVAAVVDEPR